ncbi:MAG: thermonuclease family protein [Candidatus Methanospirareceae archaeon]
MQPEYIYKAKLERVVDGDTVDLIVDVGFYISVHQRFRLKGIDTPEIFGVSKDSVQYKRGIDIWLGDSLLNEELLDEGLADKI